MNRKDIEGIYPLAPSQLGMLLETLAAPGSGVHVEQASWRLRGPLDVEACRCAWLKVMERHPVLRTAFAHQGADEPLQVVIRKATLPLHTEDWAGLSDTQQEERLIEYLDATRHRGFNLARLPLMDFGLFRLDDKAHYLAWTFHHILMDGWCLPLVLEEAFTLYEGFARGIEPRLSPVRPYSDYITWLKCQDLSKAEQYWRATLQGFTGPTPLGAATEESRRAIATTDRFGQQRACLSAEVSKGMQTLVRRYRVGWSHLIQAVWAMLLNRYSGDCDVVFGVTVSGRPPELPGSESMIGLFINTVPVRVRLIGDDSFWSLVRQLQEHHMEQQIFEYCSAGQIQQWSEVGRGSSLYQSILVVENFPTRASPAGPVDYAISATDFRHIGAQTNHALSLLVMPGTELSFRAVYDRQFLDYDDVALMLRHVCLLLQGIAGAGQEPCIAGLMAQLPSHEIPNYQPLISAPALRPQTVVAPRTSTEFQLAGIWESILGMHPVGVRDNFFELGGHSLLVLRLVKQVDEVFGRKLPLTVVFQAATIEDLAAVLDKGNTTTVWSPLVKIQPHGAKQPLFCIHPLGGNVLCYADLARYLSRDQPVYGLQARGMEIGQQPTTRLEQMAAEYLTVMQDLQTKGPYCLAGYSFGGYVAYEMAQCLRAAGQPVSLLALFDTPAPSVVPGRINRHDAAELLVSLFPALELSLSDLRQLDSEDAQLEYVMTRAQRANFVPACFGLDEARRFFNVCKVNHQMPIELRPFEGRVSLFRAREQAERISTAPALGWETMAQGGLHLHWVEGKHETMMVAPHVQSLALLLERHLCEANAS